ncbi:TPA: restriction endonuclease subunit S [Escherichia coli]|uniref:restriction endonuclease subunit S n=1 Tax=Escherichia coli TaxID=562 RepID=UPI001AD76FC6|nr:restriction endonuclease subunit S [Escherichia coli]EFO2963200.1 restriction endonuclease subunit S [Escherichia coli]EID2893913.1 restriction endonuclease subunit S [Escherichia coli]ELS9882173.1 restriction endonuclease subunit S [Escherichia coli]MCX3858406.1 restriction endonuclease subunit S [Escherichia coli]MDD8081557.1 restriction endonuclease subunit S [Escherichia coli]
MVPKGWSESYLGEVVTYKKGYAFNSSLYAEEGIRIVRISDTTRDSIHSDNPVFIAGGNVEGLEQYSLFENDIILSTVGSRPHLLDSMVGKAVKVPRSAHNSLLNQNLVKLIPKKTKITNEYLFSMLKKKEFIQFISNLVRGNANQVSITLADLFKYKFILPSLPEQKKIAQILSTWDKAISVTEKLLTNSQQQKKALMQQLLTGKKRLLDENGVRFSGEWQSLQISDIGTVVTGSTPPKNDSDNYGGDISWATAEDFVGKYVSNTKIKLSEQGAKKARIVPKGSILVTCIASIGKNAIADENMGTNQQINSVIVRGSNSNEFFYYQIEFNVKTLLTLAGTTAVPIINKSSFEKVSLKFPHFEEQQKIADVLSAADAEITTLQKKLACLKEEKKALMQQLLTGKRRVKVEAEEAVSA